ncbi:MAG TPA: phosphoribosylanthranilate isomerase [Terriglobales bacterium]|nr:phosphoribosylanthranilate isomerase [Terriglobales bacterium]
MEPVRRPRVKICCIADLQEAWLAIRQGASAVGLVSRMPSGPGVISEDQITQITAKVPPPVATFLLTCEQDVQAIIAQQRRCRTNTVQICDRLTNGSYRDLKHALPGVAIVQAIHVTGPASVDEALSVAPQVDAILLDSGNTALAVKELGGTGRRHDWTLSRKIREQINIPVFLAGGLNPGNVRRAIEEVGPFGLDMCTGVRTEGKLDANKLAGVFGSICS